MTRLIFLFSILYTVLHMTTLSAQTWSPDDIMQNTLRREGQLLTLELRPMDKHVEIKAVGHTVAEIQQKGIKLFIKTGLGKDKELIEITPKGSSYIIKKSQLKKPDLNILVKPRAGESENILFNLK